MGALRRLGRHVLALITAAAIAWPDAAALARGSPGPDTAGRALGGGYATCGDAHAFDRAAAANAGTFEALGWSPFGVPEKGWAAYETLIGHEIGTTCGAGTSNFAQALSVFQARYGLPADGVFTPATFDVFKGVWQERRPFVMMRVQSLCPDPPADELLIPLPTSEETFGREGRALRLDAFLAYQRMAAAARAESAAIRADPKALTLFSGYRSPEADQARCASEHNCDGAHRAACSAHRTGTAMDLNVGWVPGVAADATGFDNRMLQTRTAAYRWMVDNAARFGFVNYPFEPWHWEYVGPLTAVGQTPLPAKSKTTLTLQQSVLQSSTTLQSPAAPQSSGPH